jgi:hypothetical protein
MLYFQRGAERKLVDIHKALDQISEIHGHLAKTDVYRGYKAVPVALSGVLALVAATVQTRLVENDWPQYFVLYWMVGALICSATAAAGIAYSYIREESQLARRRTRATVGQLLPCLVAGFGIAALMAGLGSDAIAFVPGLWAVLFSLGIFASRPYLPRMIGWVALYYLVAGTVLLAMAVEPTTLSGWGTSFTVGFPQTAAGDPRSLSPWGMGVTFGFGQIMAGIVLYWNLERRSVR